MTEVDIPEYELSSADAIEGELSTTDVMAPNGVAAPDLIRGSSSQTANYGSNEDRINDPIWYVERFRKHREQSVREVVNSAIAVCEGLDAIGGDNTEFRRFVKALADSKVMSQAEAQKQKRADMSTLSKIQKIYEHREIILHQSVADKLCTGYSVLYELGLLIDHFMPAGEVTDDVVTGVSDQLRKILETLDGELTKSWINGIRVSLGAVTPREKNATPKVPAPSKKSANNPQLDAQAGHDEDDADEVDVSDDAETQGDDEEMLSDDDGTSSARVDYLPDVDPITAALLVVTDKNAEKLSLAALEGAWHKMADKMAADSVAFIFGPLQMLLRIIPEAGTFGCGRCANVYLLAEPDYLEVTKCNVLAIFERGEGVSVQGVPSWGPDDTPVSIAEQFLQGVPGRRLQIFADGPVEGWDTLTFDDDYTPVLHRSVT